MTASARPLEARHCRIAHRPEMRAGLGLRLILRNQTLDHLRLEGARHVGLVLAVRELMVSSFDS
jgi:hypothetical protein